MPQSTQVRLAARPTGAASVDNFRIEKVEINPPEPGQVLLRTLYLSLDPYMRGRMNAAKSYAPPLEVGKVMFGGTVSEVIASRSPDIVAGDVVFGYTGWQTHAVADAAKLRKLDPAVAPVTTALGVLGTPGFTGYSGLVKIGKPRPGETVVVSAASGAVGGTAGQLAQIFGARAVGIAGGPQKVAFVRDELGFDAAVDYQAPDFTDRLREATPAGVDVYFENVGGPVFSAVRPLLNDFARVTLCGLISRYDTTEIPDGPDNLPGFLSQVLHQQITVQGFVNRWFENELTDAFQRDVGRWFAEGRIRYREDIVDGLENAPQAFLRLFTGQNFGKLIVRVDPDPDTRIPR